MIDPQKDLKISLNGIKPTKVTDPSLERSKYDTFLDYLNPTDPTFIERSKYEQFVKQQAAAKED